MENENYRNESQIGKCISSLCISKDCRNKTAEIRAKVVLTNSLLNFYSHHTSKIVREEIKLRFTALCWLNNKSLDRGIIILIRA